MNLRSSLFTPRGVSSRYIRRMTQVQQTTTQKSSVLLTFYFFKLGSSSRTSGHFQIQKPRCECELHYQTTMPPPKPSLHYLFLFLTLVLTTSLLPFPTHSDSNSDIVAELLALQSQSKSGVIHLNDGILRRILSTTPRRSFSFIIFFDATQLHDKAELQLPTLKSEFSIVASSFIENNKDSPSREKLFFFEIEFKESQQSFALFGINALPHIRLVSPSVENVRDSDQLGQGSFNDLVESLSNFIESKTKISVGPIHRPPMFSGKQIALLAVVLAIWAPFAIRKVINGETLLHNYKFWLFGAVFVYFFSVSGTMHNIIRKMPMFIPDRQDPSKLVFFYQGSGMQLGAEGFAVGFLYTIVGVLLALVTHGLVKVRNVAVQRTVMILGLIVSFWAVRKVIFLDNWKTGYGIHGFWPSSWR